MCPLENKGVYGLVVSSSWVRQSYGWFLIDFSENFSDHNALIGVKHEASPRTGMGPGCVKTLKATARAQQ